MAQLAKVSGMRGFELGVWVLSASLLPLLASTAFAQNPEPVASDEQASTPRGYLSDGTMPAISKGRPAQADVQSAGFQSPLAFLTVPRMPHGFLDATHPAGPADPGSAAPPPKAPKLRVGPVSSGYAFVHKQW